ncbi:MAG TPA: hypothetical protein VNT31_10610 [Nocardioides sp.]|nr:hypothetical protein [Nocardioides sp.]
MTDLRVLIADVLLTTEDDWSDARTIVGLTFEHTATTAEANGLALQTIIECLRAGLLVAGDYEAAGFRAWPVSTEEAIARIIREWADLGDRAPTPDTIAWFDLTELGEQRAQGLAARPTRADHQSTTGWSGESP